MPFTIEQFLEVFKNYNETVWPMQILLVLFGLTAIVLSVRKIPSSDMVISGILAYLWLWMGIAYHLLNFSSINPAAYVFGTLCIIQGACFILAGYVRRSIAFRFRNDMFGWAGGVMIFYAMVVYPLLGILFGHAYPYSPTFGLPCPTTIFTFGMLLATERKIPWYLLVVPFLWSILGFSAAFSFGIYEDTGLLISGIAATGLILYRDRIQSRKASVELI